MRDGLGRDNYWRSVSGAELLIRKHRKNSFSSRSEKVFGIWFLGTLGYLTGSWIFRVLYRVNSRFWNFCCLKICMAQQFNIMSKSLLCLYIPLYDRICSNMLIYNMLRYAHTWSHMMSSSEQVKSSSRIQSRTVVYGHRWFFWLSEW